MIGMRARPEMLPRLARFIKLLATNGIVEFGEPLPRGERGLVVVDRIRQCAFLALHYGHDTAFDFGPLGNGPVSEEIAGGVHRAASPDVPASFRAAELPGIASGRGPSGRALRSLFDVITNYRKDLHWRKLKYLIWRSRGAVDNAFDEIMRHGMFRTG